MPDMNMNLERLDPALTENSLLGRNQQQAAQMAIFTYDFKLHGGAIGTIPLQGDLLPANCVVYGALLRVEKALTGATAQMALQLEAANDLQTATVVTGAPYSTTGTKALSPVWSAASAVNTTAVRQVKALISVAAVTAGKLQVVLFYTVFDAG